MGVRCGGRVQLTVACAMIGRFLADMDAYLAAKVAIERLARELAAAHGFAEADIAVNCADDVAAGSVYLTVTGTSAESGDDGEVGRGNRANGLITPGRPMSLEAVAGKNPVTHVGKIYNAAARDIAQALVTALPQIGRAHCLLVSRIGAPVTEPAIVEIRLALRDGAALGPLRTRVREIASERIAHMLDLVDRFVAGTIEVY
jgi:S-adenosylmethionine synthetase